MMMMNVRVNTCLYLIPNLRADGLCELDLGHVSFDRNNTTAGGQRADIYHESLALGQFGYLNIAVNVNKHSNNIVGQPWRPSRHPRCEHRVGVGVRRS